MAASAKRLEKDTNRLEIDTNKLREALGENFVNLETIVNQVKGDALTLIHDAKSGHPGGCMAIVRPLLMYYALAHDNSAGVHLSGGHLAPVMYVLGHLFGTPETAITDEEMALFRTIEGLS